MPEPNWMINIQHDRSPIKPAECFRELRPILPDAGSRYVPREAPTVPMFASEIRTQPREPDRVWLKPTDLKRGTARANAKRVRDAEINRKAAGAMRRAKKEAAA